MVEITTYRTDAYDPTSRKPEVDFGDTLAGDLVRRDFTVNAMAVRLPALDVRRPVRRPGRPRAPACCARPARPEESFADDPLRMMRAARFAAQLGFAVGPRGRGGDDRDGATGSRSSRPSGSATSWSSWSARRTPRPGSTLLVEHRAGRRTCCPSCRRCALEIDEHHRHKDVYEHTLTVLEQAIDLEDRGCRSRCPARTSCCGSPRCCTTSASRATRRFEDGGGVTFHHHEVVGAKLARKRLQALRFAKDDDRRGRPAGRAAPALPRLRRRASGPTRPCAATSATPATSWSGCTCSPAPTARPATSARPSGCAAPTTTSRTGSRGCGAGGAGLDPARPRRQPDHGDPRHRARPGGRRGLPVPAASCGWTRARSAPRPRPRPCASGGPPSPRAPRPDRPRPPDRWRPRPSAPPAWLVPADFVPVARRNRALGGRDADERARSGSDGPLPELRKWLRCSACPAGGRA